jgi:three-Cys-motif partner protein
MLRTQKKNPHHSQKMAYIDLFAGPGKYDDECQSTPLMVLETIISNPELSDRVVTIFNDKNTDSINSLQNAVMYLTDINKLTFQPRFYNLEVGEKIAELFKNTKMVPTFFFIDPWGYKGLSLNLVSSFIKDWGSDGVFFLITTE